MNRKSALTFKKLLEAVIEEADSNPEFSKKLENILNGSMSDEPEKPSAMMSTGAKRSGNRRAPAALDPIALVEEGEDILLEQLNNLTDKELKDIIADYGMDPSKLAMKWKNRDRLINLIIDTSHRRASKGDAFRDSSDEE